MYYGGEIRYYLEPNLQRLSSSQKNKAGVELPERARAR